MFVQVTDSEGNQTLVFFGTGGAIKATQFDDDKTTELYNAEGNMVAKVKETIQDLQMKGVR